MRSPGALLEGKEEGDRYMPADPNGVGTNLRRRLITAITLAPTKAPTLSPTTPPCGGLGQAPCPDTANNGCKSFHNGAGTLVLDGTMCVGCGGGAEKVCTDHYGPNNGCQAGNSPTIGDGRCYAKSTAVPSKAPTVHAADEYFLPTDDVAHADLVAHIGTGTGEHFSDPMCQLVCPCQLLPNEPPAEPLLPLALPVEP